MSHEVHRHSFVLTRDAAASEDGRTLLIRAVPWNTEARIGPKTWESFDPHAFDRQMPAARRLKLTLGHPRAGDRLTDSLVGSVKGMESKGDGLHIEARMASSTTATEALALINDGVLDQVSIGFIDEGTRRSNRPDGSTLLHRTRARLDHVALVASGAYDDGARVLAVREEPNMDDDPDAEEEPDEGDPDEGEEPAEDDAADPDVEQLVELLSSFLRKVAQSSAPAAEADAEPDPGADLAGLREACTRLGVKLR